jgi:hypothetical protein
MGKGTRWFSVDAIARLDSFSVAIASGFACRGTSSRSSRHTSLSNTSVEQNVSITNASTRDFGVFCLPHSTLGDLHFAWSSWVSASGTVTLVRTVENVNCVDLC